MTRLAIYDKRSEKILWQTFSVGNKIKKIIWKKIEVVCTLKRERQLLGKL